MRPSAIAAPRPRPSRRALRALLRVRTWGFADRTRTISTVFARDRRAKNACRGGCVPGICPPPVPWHGFRETLVRPWRGVPKRDRARRMHCSGMQSTISGCRMSSVSGQLLETITPRRWAAIVRNTFVPLALLVDVLTIVAAAGLTGAVYHKLVYGAADDSLYFFEVGAVAASIFALPNIFRGEYSLPNYFSFRPHVRRSLHLWHVTFLCLLAIGFVTKMTDVYSRGATILLYVAGFPAVMLTRYALVSAAVKGSRIGLVTAQRVFLVGARNEIIAF